MFGVAGAALLDNEASMLGTATESRDFAWDEEECILSSATLMVCDDARLLVFALEPGLGFSFWYLAMSLL